MRRHRWWHRWTRWKSEFEECPEGWGLGVYEFRSRHCKRCRMVEEESRCVSSSPAVVRGLTP